LKIKISAHRDRRAVGPVLLALMVVSAGVAEAQRTIPGYVRSDQSDVTGPAVTSGDQLAAMFTEPGTVLSMFCPVAWGVRTAGDATQARLASATLQPALQVVGDEIGSTAQLLVLNLLIAPAGERQVRAPVVAALTRNNDGAAERPARRLVEATHGLLAIVEEMDPLYPGEAVATRLSYAVGAYNALIDASSAGFLTSPPQELTALHAVLNQLVIASLENEGRPTEITVVDDAGLACAIPFTPPPPAAPPAPPPPVEQAIEMCILVDGDFRDIAAIRRPESADTVVIVSGVRRPLLEVYPGATDVPTASWVPLGAAVTIGGAQYQPFGVSRTVDPGELTRRGELDGFDYYTTPNEPATPSVVYFVAGPECEVQPYRAAETIRVRG